MRNDGEILVILDVEGPQTLGDNAFETTVELAKLYGLSEEIGREFYKRISNIDDIWGIFHKIPCDPSYSPGHTLKVMLPFFAAMGATKEELYRIARENLRIVPDIKKVLAVLQKKYEVWMISTSYYWFIRAYCDYVDFPFDHTYCTKVENYEQTPIAKKQRELLLRFMENVATMPVIEYDHQTGEITPDHQECYDIITKFIWETIYNMPLGNLLRTVRPIGQTQKTEALGKIKQKTGFPKRKIMYVGDSITDEGAMEWLRGIGLTMAFNGKGRVCDISDLMFIGESAIAILQVAENFAEYGRDTTLNYCYSTPQNTIGGVITAVTRKNIKKLKQQSEKMRKDFRGEHIGALT